MCARACVCVRTSNREIELVNDSYYLVVRIYPLAALCSPAAVRAIDLGRRRSAWKTKADHRQARPSPFEFSIGALLYSVHRDADRDGGTSPSPSPSSGGSGGAARVDRGPDAFRAKTHGDSRNLFIQSEVQTRRHNYLRCGQHIARMTTTTPKSGGRILSPKFSFLQIRRRESE